MRLCIYHKKSEPDLKFTKREHVIPAGIGGINTLPLGYVSDEVNESFSPLEMEILRNSFISINRNNVGPGKRGTLNVKKQKAPIIRVLKDSGEDDGNLIENYKLGFVFSGESYIITQIALDFNDEENYFTMSYSSTVFDIQNSKEIVLEFKKRLIQFLLNKKRNFKLIKMPYSTNKHFINIGLHEGKWFATTSHERINMDVLSWDLVPALKEEKLEYSEPMVQPKSLFEYTYKINTDSVLLNFMFVKTAFNSLAFIKGSDFACNEIFDEVRNSIVNQKNLNNFLVMDINLPNIFEEIINNIPDKAHYVIITSNNESVLAYVSFYNTKPILVNLTNQYKGEVFTKGIVCDWKNRKEFLIGQ
jgi:hypothetical protein